MKLNQREIEFFKNINNTEVASGITEYLERLTGYICDSRNWDELGITGKEIANASEKVIRDFVIDKIKLQNKSKSVEGNSYE